MTTRLAPLLLLALALAAPARADDDEPPADLLGHLKVGQRWTFVTTSGDTRLEEVWVVGRIDAAEKRVVYLTTVRSFQGQKMIMEQIGQEALEWTGGGKHEQIAAAAGALGVSSRRDKLEVSGLKLDCYVARTKTQEGEQGLEQWWAMKGDWETFPGLVKVTANGAATRVLTKVEEGPAPTMPGPKPETQEGEAKLPAGALDHVKVGQRWVFKVGSGGEAELTWTVLKVDVAEGKVTYKIKSVVKVGGQTMTTEEEEPGEWTGGNVPVLPPGLTVEGVKGERKKLENVKGAALDCYLVTMGEGAEASTIWIAVKGDHEVFPGPVKQVVGGQTMQELLRVE
jgi:hypothetical protein